LRERKCDDLFQNRYFHLRDFYCLTKKETFLFRTSESLKYETTKCELAYLIDVQSFTILKEIINVGLRQKSLSVVLVATTTTKKKKKLEDVMARCQQHLKSKSGKHNKHFINKKCLDGL